MKNPVEIFTENEITYRKSLNTSKISHIKAGGIADYAAFPDTESKLVATVRGLTESSCRYKIIGRCSNVFFSDEGFCGTIISTSRLKETLFCEDYVVCGAGASVQNVMTEAKKRNLAIPAELCGIPGSIGGMVFGNAGAFGKCMADVFLWGKFYDAESDRIRILSNSQMKFEYRSSALVGSSLCLLEAALKCSPMNPLEFSERIAYYSGMRSATQPAGASLGSFFKRCCGIIPARLIDEAGLKGYSVGGAEVSRKHAGFIINSGNATAKDINDLADYIVKKINEAYGVSLVREAEYVK